MTANSTAAASVMAAPRLSAAANRPSSSARGSGQRPLAVPLLLQRFDQPDRLALGRCRRPQGDRLGGPPGRPAQVTALLDDVDHAQRIAAVHRELGRLA